MLIPATQRLFVYVCCVSGGSFTNTFHKYEVLVDKFARQRRRKPEYERKTCFGQLQHIFVVKLPVIASLRLTEPRTIFLAGIRPCDVVAFDSLGNQYYSKLGQLGAVDMTCVQCVVGRVKVDNLWAIIDRSGHASPSAYLEDPECIPS